MIFNTILINSILKIIHNNNSNVFMLTHLLSNNYGVVEICLNPNFSAKFMDFEL